MAHDSHHFHSYQTIQRGSLPIKVSSAILEETTSIRIKMFLQKTKAFTQNNLYWFPSKGESGQKTTEAKSITDTTELQGPPRCCIKVSEFSLNMSPIWGFMFLFFVYTTLKRLHDVRPHHSQMLQMNNKIEKK